MQNNTHRRIEVQVVYKGSGIDVTRTENVTGASPEQIRQTVAWLNGKIDRNTYRVRVVEITTTELSF